MKRKKLRNLRITEVSLVDHPANKSARAVLWKRDPGAPPPDPIPAHAETTDPAPAGFFFDPNHRGDWNMPTQKSAEELAAALEKAAAANELLTAEIEVMKARAALSADEAAFMGNLPEDEQDKFALLSKADRETAMQRAAADPVAKAMRAEIEELRKQSEADRAALQAELQKRERLEAEAMVEKEYGNLPGETTAKAQALLAIAKMEEAPRKVVEAMLKAGNAAMGAGFTLRGSDSDPATIGKADAAEQLDQLAAEEAKRSGISKAEAYSVVSRTDKGRNLLQQARQ